MIRCAVALAGTAAAFAAVDLAHKAAAGDAPMHARSMGYVTLVLGLATGWAGAIVLTRSLAMALSGGVVVGGALGNVVSLAFWPGVPNPIETASFALNLADLFVLVGFGVVSVSALRLARLERERLGEPLRLR